MLRIVRALAVVVALASCSSGSSGIGAAGDAGADGGDAGSAPSLCTRQPENVRVQLCDAATSNVLLACDEGAAPPSSECTKTVQANAYCCAVPATPGDAGADAPTGGGLNPYGVPYPTDHLGTRARGGDTRGDRVSNLSMQGYPPGSTTLGTVSLASLYDPQGKTHDVVVIVAGALWDTFTPKTLAAVKGSTKRIATLAVLGQGVSPGATATLANLSTWRASYPWATTALDSGFVALGPFFDGAAVPFVMFIDARTMEIASAGVGSIMTSQEIDTAATAVTSLPAAY
ncbi:MAG TPA: hypothetical protein VLT33_34235 [Labilithrix sp.]|nr:hypothetical protein [Labilithrix sp.]